MDYKDTYVNIVAVCKTLDFPKYFIEGRGVHGQTKQNLNLKDVLI